MKTMVNDWLIISAHLTISKTKNIQKVVTKYFPILKAEHILMACDSIFPSSDRDIFTGFSRKAKFHDKNVS